MGHKALLRFLIIFLVFFSYVRSSMTIPQSAFLKSDNQDPTIQELKQGLLEGRKYGEGLDWERAIIRGRMDIETNDYAGTGANHDHEPQTPGRR